MAFSVRRAQPFLTTYLRSATTSRATHSLPLARVNCHLRLANCRWLQMSQPLGRMASTATARAESAEEPASYSNIVDSKMPMTKFSELEDSGLVSPNVIRALRESKGIDTMTPVQSQTIPEILRGKDVIAQARTGTGKTLAFLIPIVQRILNETPALANPRSRYGFGRRQEPDVKAIIISPTRELAQQIASEARQVIQGTGITVQTAVGGTGKRMGLQRIRENGCHILVATPGRLNDILSDRAMGIQVPKLSTLVFDEADRLLDAGFGREIGEIMEGIPSRRDVDRQTLMFSATMPNEVMGLVRDILKSDFDFVQTVKPGEQPTHTKVPQKLVEVNGFENMMPALLEFIKRELQRNDADRPFKALVFFNANSETQLNARVFRSMKDDSGRWLFSDHGLGARVIEMHGRLTQNERTQASNAFRRAKQAIMFSSDVSARGMDFPDVTHVIQIGLPRDDDTYVHRVGRTARGDKLGEGWLFVSRFEKQFMMRNRLTRMPLTEDTSLETARIDMTRDAQLPASVASCLTETINASKLIDPQTKQDAYKAMLGVFSNAPSRQGLVDAMNRRALYEWGLAEPPKIDSGLAMRLGLKNVRGLNFEDRYQRDGDDGGNPGFSDRRNRNSGNRYGLANDRFADSSGRRNAYLDGPRAGTDRGNDDFGGRQNRYFDDRFGSRYGSDRQNTRHGGYGGRRY